MDSEIQNFDFTYQSKSYHADALIDASDFPGYIFVTLKESALTAEFGEDVSIKTDFMTLLSTKDDYLQLRLLRQSIFEQLISHPKFEAAKHQLLSKKKLSATIRPFF